MKVFSFAILAVAFVPSQASGSATETAQTGALKGSGPKVLNKLPVCYGICAHGKNNGKGPCNDSLFRGCCSNGAPIYGKVNGTVQQICDCAGSSWCPKVQAEPEPESVVASL